MDLVFQNQKDLNKAKKIVKLVFDSEFTERGKKLNAVLMKQFNNEKTSSGSKWSQLKDRTQNDREAKGYGRKTPILEREGTLKNSILFSFDGETLAQHTIFRKSPTVVDKMADISEGLQKKRPHTDLKNTYYPGGKNYKKFEKKVALRLAKALKRAGIGWRIE